MVMKSKKTVKTVNATVGRMPCSFAEFQSRCRAQGYTDVIDQTVAAVAYEIYAVFVTTASGARVKCEIKRNRYTLGYGLGKNVPVLRDYLRENTGFECSDGNKCFNIAYAVGATVDTIFNDFFSLIADIVNIDNIIQNQRGQARKVFSREVAEQNIFEKIAKRYRFAIDNEDQGLLDLARDLLSSDALNHLITIGESRNRTADNSYREHIVPCVLIHNHIIELTLAGRAYTEVAQIIKENLAIVLITVEEQVLIDNTLGLKTSMPEGWEFGDTVFARLDAGGIERK